MLTLQQFKLNLRIGPGGCGLRDELAFKLLFRPEAVLDVCSDWEQRYSSQLGWL